MANNVLVSDMIAEVRQHADMENSQFVTDATIIKFLNRAQGQLHDILVDHYGENFFLKSATFSLTTSTTDYTLSTIAADFYKLRAVDVLIHGDWLELDRLEFQNRNQYINADVWSQTTTLRPAYELQGSKLFILPAPSGTYSAKLWYVPTFTRFTAGSDTFDSINGWDEFLTLRAAMWCLQKEESDDSALARDFVDCKARIAKAAKYRDMGTNAVIKDVRGKRRGRL